MASKQTGSHRICLPSEIWWLNPLVYHFARELFFFFFFFFLRFYGLWLVCFVCRGLFALPLGVFGGLCSEILVIPGHLYFFLYNTWNF